MLRRNQRENWASCRTQAGGPAASCSEVLASGETFSVCGTNAWGQGGLQQRGVVQLRLPSMWRARAAAEFENLKHRLLLRELDDIPNSESHALVFRAANQAAALARQTPFPLLAFPCLFEERARAARERERQERLVYWRGFEFIRPSSMPQISNGLVAAPV